MAGWREEGAFDELLRGRGFRARGAAVQERRNEAGALGLREGGDYRVLGAYAKGDVKVLVEQNESPNPFGPPNEPYRSMPVVHDPVAIVEGPVGRVVVNLADDDAAEVLKRAEQAVTDPNYQSEVT